MINHNIIIACGSKESPEQPIPKPKSNYILKTSDIPSRRAPQVMLLEMYILIVLNLTACKRTNLHGFLWCLMNICFLTLFLCLACQYSLFSEYCSNFDTFGPNPNSQFCCDIKVTRKYDPCHNEVTICSFSDDNFELSHGKKRKYFENM